MNKKYFDLSGKTAIVTGGGSGIGKAISITLADNGAKVIIFDLNTDKAQETISEIESNGGSASVESCNVADPTSVKKAFESSLKGKTLNILVNNAGIAHIGTASSTEPEDFDRIYDVNIKGVYNCIHEGIKYMDKGGSIVNMSSIAAHVGIPDRFAYSVSKGAIHAMTLSVAKDYIEKGIRCNSIAPARIHTPFVDGFLSKTYPGQEKEMFDKLSKTQPIGRMGLPEEVGALALYLCSDEASFLTGTCFPIDGGFITLNA